MFSRCSKSKTSTITWRFGQVVSCAQDGKLLFWDVDYPDPTGGSHSGSGCAAAAADDDDDRP